MLFVAVSGTTVDGHDYIGKAIEKGAGAIVCEKIPEQLETREAAPEAHRGAHRRAKAKLSGTAALSFVPSASFDGGPASPAIHRLSDSGRGPRGQSSFLEGPSPTRP